MRELDHRVANSLAVIRSVFRRTADGASSVRDLKEVFEARLQSIANAHRLLASGGWTSATLRENAEATLEPYGGEEPSYVLSGPEVHLPSKMVMDLTMVLHELATNAARYGALSAPEGRVDVRWRVTDQAAGHQVEVEWQEIGGPPVDKPDRQGFGLTLIEGLITGNLKGSVQLEYEPAGLRAQFLVPLSTLDSCRESARIPARCAAAQKMRSAFAQVTGPPCSDPDGVAPRGGNGETTLLTSGRAGCPVSASSVPSCRD